MREAEDILAEFDNPMDETPVGVYDSVVSTKRDRASLEVLLDMRELLVEIKEAIGECKEELQEIKENTAS